MRVISNCSAPESTFKAGLLRVVLWPALTLASGLAFLAGMLSPRSQPDERQPG
jgi:hypothetical protein